MKKLRVSHSSMKKSQVNDIFNDTQLNQKFSQITSQYENLLNKLQFDVIRKEFKQLQKTYIQEQKLIQAQNIKHMLSKINKQIYELQGQAISKKNVLQHTDLEQLIEVELNSFNIKWETILQQIRQQTCKSQQKMLQHHKQQYQKYKKSLQNQQTLKVKYSREVLRLKNNLENLVSTRQYQQAKDTNGKIKMIESIETKEWQKKQDSKHKVKLTEILKKQNNQIVALRIKNKILLLQKQKQKEHQLQQLLKKSINKRRQLQSKQQLMKARHNTLEKTINLNKSLKKNRKSFTSSKQS